MLKTSDLTPGERLLVDRRRRGEAQDAAAKRLGVTRYRYRKWEGDEADDETPPKPALGPLRDFESCHLRRRRLGVSLIDLAKRVDVSHWWLCQMEGGDAPADRLVDFWKAPPRDIAEREAAAD